MGSRNYNKNALKKAVTKGYDPNENPIYCASFGCGKKLKPTETLYGKYCFTCASDRSQRERDRLRLANHSSKFYIHKYRWAAINGKWEKVRELEVTKEKFIDNLYSDEYIEDNSKVFYRYDLFVNTASVDIIYSYTPHLFD